MKKISIYAIVILLSITSCREAETEIVDVKDATTSAKKERMISQAAIVLPDVNIYRYYSPSRRQHYYTKLTPLNDLNDPYFIHEGTLGKLSSFGFYNAVHVYIKSSNRDQFLTTNPNQELLNSNWVYKGIIGYSVGNYPVYRYYSSRQNDHFYTTNFNELGNGNSSYIYEGIAFYVK